MAILVFFKDIFEKKHLVFQKKFLNVFRTLKKKYFARHLKNIKQHSAASKKTGFLPRLTPYFPNKKPQNLNTFRNPKRKYYLKSFLEKRSLFSGFENMPGCFKKTHILFHRTPNFDSFENYWATLLFEKHSSDKHPRLSIGKNQGFPSVTNFFSPLKNLNFESFEFFWAKISVETQYR